MSTAADWATAVDAGKLTRASVRQFVFLLKCVAENDLWTDVERHLKERGVTEISVSSAPIAAIQELLNDKIAAGVPLNARAARIASCGLCNDPDPRPSR